MVEISLKVKFELHEKMFCFVYSQLFVPRRETVVENTSRELLSDIEETIRKLFEVRIEKSDDYVKFQDELLAFERHRHAEEEAYDYKRRLKRLEAKEVTTINGVEFYSPKSEADLTALVSGMSAQLLTLLPFAIRDCDSHFGFGSFSRARCRSSYEALSDRYSGGSISGAMIMTTMI